ncbi:MAG: cysteine desulfurase [Candidatus Kaiserbacteria bacterium]|nr:cysteine desulfurase [Candidatus Kaiserbacteria bacterium]MCB9816791.1 cysteine desulfurase [Candidatus Nomurabacteria bacterium]
MNQIETRKVYLDHAAATPVDPEVAALLLQHTSETYGNASSMYEIGRKAHDTLAAARQSVAASLAVEPSEIIFTGSGTESDNLAILGAARARKDRGKHIVVTAIEHKAVLAAAKVLERDGFAVTYVPVESSGIASVGDVLAAVRPDTTLVSVMYANNEIGTIQPIAEIAQALRQINEAKRPLFHTDACQTAGQLEVLPRELGVDLLTLNGAKIYGPKGLGMLYVRRGVRLEPLIVGGGQEGGLRAGTENAALIAGFAKALELAVVRRAAEAARLTDLRNHFWHQLHTVLPDIVMNGDPDVRLPNNLHITVPTLEGESLVLELDHYGIAAATGSACSAHDLTPSHVLQAIGIPDGLIHGSLRFTLGRETTKDDLEYTVQCLKKSVDRLRQLTAATTSHIEFAV